FAVVESCTLGQHSVADLHVHARHNDQRRGAMDRHPDRRLFSAIGFCRACAECQPGEYAGEEATKYRRYPRFTHSDTLLVRYHLWIDCADKYVDCGAVAAYMSVNHVYRPGADALPCH